MKEPTLSQLDKLLYKSFTAMHSDGKHVIGPMINKAAKFCYGQKN
jgi:hypothetical protein